MAKFAGTLLALLFALTVTAAWAAPVPKRDAALPELPDEVVKEWERAGASRGWLRADTYGTVEHDIGSAVPGALPAFYFNSAPRHLLGGITGFGGGQFGNLGGQFGIAGAGPLGNGGGFGNFGGNFNGQQFVPIEYSALPKPGRPFALVFEDSYIPPASAGLHKLEHLNTIHVRPTATSGLNWLAPITQLRGLRLAPVDEVPEWNAELRHLAGLKHLHALNLNGTATTDAGLKHVAALRNLQWLDAGGTPITDAGLKHLAGLPNLLRVRLARTGVTDAGLALLARHTDLTHLDLSGTRVTDAGLKHLAGCRELVELNLTGASVTAEGLKALAGLPRLRKLSLADTGASDAELEVLAACTELRELSVENTGITDAGLKHLAGLKKLAKLDLSGCRSLKGAGLRPLAALTDLDLSGSLIGDAALEDVGTMKGLVRLRLCSADVRGPGLKSLAGLANLEHLDLSDNPIRDAAVEPLTRLPQLRTLNLSGALTEDGALKHLAKCPRLERLHVRTATDTGLGYMSGAPALKRLEIDAAQEVTAKGVRKIADLKGLELLRVSGSQLSAEDLNDLREKHPKLSINDIQ